MAEEVRCQSCGMKMVDGFFGSDKSGQENHDYCKFCFQDGEFVMPDLQIEDMIALSVHNMTDDLGMNIDEAVKIANLEIPKLKRWCRGSV